jgi:hypothetical protein
MKVNIFKENKMHSPFKEDWDCAPMDHKTKIIGRSQNENQELA